MGALLRVDMATDVLPQQTFVGEYLVTEGACQGGVHGRHLAIEVVTELGVVGEECTAHGTGNNFFLGVASNMVLQLGSCACFEVATWFETRRQTDKYLLTLLQQVHKIEIYQQPGN